MLLFQPKERLASVRRVKKSLVVLNRMAGPFNTAKLTQLVVNKAISNINVTVVLIVPVES